MTRTLALRKLLEDKLNILGQANPKKKFTFGIIADVGENPKGAMVNGQLIERVNGNTVPVQQFTNAILEYVLEFTVQAAMSNINVEAVNKILKQLIKELNATNQPLDKGKGAFVFQTPVFHSFATRGGVGRSVICTMPFELDYSEDAVSSCDRVWLLDDEPLDALNDYIEVTKQGTQNKVHGKKATESLTIQQTRLYKFEVPYRSNNPANIKIEKALLDGNLNQTFTLTFYDGVTYTQASPLIRKVQLFDTGRSEAETPKVVNRIIAFADTDDLTGIVYSLALVDNPFDQNSQNTRYHPSQAQQKIWFDNLITTGAPWERIKTPNINSLTVTQQVYLNSAGMDVFRLLQFNYAIIRVEQGGTSKYFFYYVSSTNVGAEGQVLCDLQMDTIQTYLFDPQITFDPCTINRAHLDRFINRNSTTVRFDGDKGSPLHEQEPLGKLAKRLMKREAFFLSNDDPSVIHPEVLRRMDITNRGWIYVFLDPNWVGASTPAGTVNATRISDSNCRMNELADRANVQRPYTVLAFPLSANPLDHPNSQVMFTHGGYDLEFWRWAIPFGQMLAPYILDVRISPVCPFPNFRSFSGYTFGNPNSSGVVNVTATSSPSGEWGHFSVFSFQGGLQSLNALAYVVRTWAAGEIMDEYLAQTRSRVVDLDEDLAKFIFDKSEIVGANKNPKFNPKLLGTNFTELRLGYGASEPFVYDLQKLDTEYALMLWQESMSPGVTRLNIGIASYYAYLGYDEIYNFDTLRSFVSMAASEDTSIPYAISALTSFLANNKNFYMQRGLNMKMQAMDISMGTANAMMGAKSVAGAFGKGLLTAGTGMAKMAAGLKQSEYTLDNMGAAPQSYKNLDGNVMASMGVSGGRCYYEIWQALSHEMELANDFMHLFGFTYKRMGNIFEFMAKRKFFNYIEADIERIKGNISTAARDDIRRRFSEGLRFFSVDTVDFTKENYEVWIETTMPLSAPAGIQPLAAPMSLTAEPVDEKPSKNTAFVKPKIAPHFEPKNTIEILP